MQNERSPGYLFYWQDVLALLRERVSPANYKTWLEPLTAVLEDECLIINLPNEFFFNWISEHYLNDIAEAVGEVFERPIEIEFRFEESEPDDSFEPLPIEAPEPAPQSGERWTAERPKLNQNYTFESFVVGPSNQFAHAACIAVATLPAHSYNPLFMYGGVGLGKTHLLHAIGNKILETMPEARIVYRTSEQFMNEMINAVRYDKLEEFHARYRDNCDVLMIDDIQFIAGKNRTQEEFFHTFNVLHNSHKQIVLTADKFPKDIPGLEERLRSRFAWGLIADIQPPELETRTAILARKAENEGLEIDNETLFYLASSIMHNIRELEGCLVRLGAFSKLTGREISIGMARELFQDTIEEVDPYTSVESIQKTVAAHYGITLAELGGSKRHKKVLIPRQVAMYLCRKFSEASYPEIGEKFGGKDHSTVINACKKVEKLLENDVKLRSDIQVLQSRIQH
jgi:chromosomal replication initiator protein